MFIIQLRKNHGLYIQIELELTIAYAFVYGIR